VSSTYFAQDETAQLCLVNGRFGMRGTAFEDKMPRGQNAGKLTSLPAADGGCCMSTLLLIVQPTDDSMTRDKLYSHEDGHKDETQFCASYNAKYHAHIMKGVHEFVLKCLATVNPRHPGKHRRALHVEDGFAGKKHGISHKCGCPPNTYTDYMSADGETTLMRYCNRHGSIDFNKGLTVCHEFYSTCLKNTGFADDMTHLPFEEISGFMKRDSYARKKFVSSKAICVGFTACSELTDGVVVGHPGLITQTSVYNGARIPCVTLRDNNFDFLVSCLAQFGGVSVRDFKEPASHTKISKKFVRDLRCCKCQKTGKSFTRVSGRSEGN